MKPHPYKDLPASSYWKRAVSTIEKHRLDPVIESKFRVNAAQRVSTAGSCFAQHISARLTKLGFNYFVPEDGGDLSESDRRARQYGVFSARYGNIYSTRQLVQLIKECYGEREVSEPAWKRPDGRWVDSLRPQVEPDGYDSPEATRQARLEHLGYVRQAFENCELFIFTLGLTETWTCKADGTAFPIAPGVVAGAYDPQRYEFLNLGVDQVVADLKEFLENLRSINPSVRVLLTVSPVPLIATYDTKHVLCATTLSKSILRVAADSVAAGSSWIDYFPSYEIITGDYTRGSYFEDDFRSVNSLGVAHAMRCFERHYLDVTATPGREEVVGRTTEEAIVCDEETLDAINV